MTTLYETLGVPSDADEVAIKTAYRKKIRQAHPDKGGSTEEAAELIVAWSVLSDPAKRLRYDQTGQTSPTPEPVTRMASDAVAIFLQVVLEEDERGDLTRIVRDKVHNTRLSALMAQGEANKALAKLRKVRNRLHFKAEDMKIPDVLGNAIDEEISKAEAHIQRISEDVKYLKELEEFVKNWDYVADPLTPAGSMSLGEFLESTRYK